MIGFTIKKWFFDLWDNLVIIVACNIVFDIILFAGFSGVMLSLPPLVSMVALILGILGMYAMASIMNGITWNISRGERFEFAAIPAMFHRGWRQSLLLGAMNVAIFFLSDIAMKFYTQLNNFEGMILMAIVFWALVFWLLLGSYFLPLNAQMDTSVKKLFRKSFLITADNPGFSIAVGIGSILILVLSIASFTLLPGITGLLLWHQTALKLRLRKYDWMEEHPGEPVKNIPWKELHQEDNDRVGHRSLKGMIFPWKD